MPDSLLSAYCRARLVLRADVAGVPRFRVAGFAGVVTSDARRVRARVFRGDGPSEESKTLTPGTVPASFSCSRRDRSVSWGGGVSQRRHKAKARCLSGRGERGGVGMAAARAPAPRRSCPDVPTGQR